MSRKKRADRERSTPFTTSGERTPPKKILLLDNDLFGQPEESWRARIAEIIDGEFMVSLNQGINIRMVNKESAAALASIDYRDDGFTTRRLYTAWDNLGDEKRFFTGLKLLNDASIPSRHVMVYMLVGYRPNETMEDILYRFNMLVEAGCKPYPMPYERSKRPDLMRFQRWAIRRYYEFIPWEEFRNSRPPRPVQREQIPLLTSHRRETTVRAGA